MTTPTQSVCFGISGSISAYKSLDIIRRLKKASIEIRPFYRNQHISLLHHGRLKPYQNRHYSINIYPMAALFIWMPFVMRKHLLFARHRPILLQKLHRVWLMIR